MFTKFLTIYTCFFLIQDSYTVEKTWICNTNADDKSHWIGGDYLHNCTGFHFPVRFKEICLMSLRELTTSAIYLPVQGDVILREGAEIILTENSDSCVVVKDDLELRDYDDPQCWMNENEAIPDVERAACKDDDVVFPEDATFNLERNVFHITENSYTIRGEKLNKLDWMLLYHTYESCPEFSWKSELRYQRTWPEICQEQNLVNYTCGLRQFWRKIVCSDPVYVQGHCTLFCGSVFLVQPDNNFEISDFFKAFTKDQTADAYYSIINSTKGTYQITMTDKGEFTGQSIFHAKKFYQQIKDDMHTWGVRSIKASFSGFPLTPEKDLRNAMGILFGTFFAVVLLFGVMFLVYSRKLERFNIIQRIPLNVGIRRPTKPFVFARFENKDDGSMSMGGSIVSLDKAFDNPMYGHQMASTSSGTTMETVEEAEEIKEDRSKVVSESEFSNPLYDESKTIVEETEE